MILFLLRRLMTSQQADQIVVATTNKPEDDILADTVSNFGLAVFRGDQDDVVARFVGAAELFGFSRIVRVTADCPFVNAEILDLVLSRCYEAAEYDLATTKGSFPVGLDFEVFSADKMKELHENAPLTQEDREHLTWHMVRQPEHFTLLQIEPLDAWIWKDGTFTVDTAEDYEWANRIAEIAGGRDATIPDIINAAKGISSPG